MDYVDESGKIKGSDKLPTCSAGCRIITKVVIRSTRSNSSTGCLEDGAVEKTTATGSKEMTVSIVWTLSGDKWLISSVRDLPTEVSDLPSLASVQLKDLEWLVGEWVDDSPKIGVALNVKWATNKAFLLMDYVVKREGQEPLEVTVRVGWDGHNNRIRSWIFDSNGGFAEAYWQKDGKRWLVGTKRHSGRWRYRRLDEHL